MNGVEGEDLQRAFLAARRAVHKPVALGLQRRLTDDVVVGDDVAGIGDEKARADAGLRA